MSEISMKEAIQIAKILSNAPQERLPLILSVLEKADFTVEGLEEVAEWKAFKEQAALIDADEFERKLFEKFPAEEGKAKIPVSEFDNFCTELKLKPLLVKRFLAGKGAIETGNDKDKVNYTKTVWIDGKAIRCVVAIRR